MLPTGDKESQFLDNNSQKVHPQPMKEAKNQTPEAIESLISKIFMNISSLKAAYIQLQAAHTPYDPDKIQGADKLVVSELKNLSELKHACRDNISKPLCPSQGLLVGGWNPGATKPAQNLWGRGEEIPVWDSEQNWEILQLQQQIEEANLKKEKLEKNLKSGACRPKIRVFWFMKMDSFLRI